MLMTCCQSAYKQNDMTYCNYGSEQPGNGNEGVGRRSEVDEGTDKSEDSLGSRCIWGAALIKI